MRILAQQNDGAKHIGSVQSDDHLLSLMAFIDAGSSLYLFFDNSSLYLA